jgi:UDP-N-acetyl-2-amino-2-deoxyglucuronate dehydrogenase
VNLNFACIGVAGYIAPRHLQAIKSLKHNLILSYDKKDAAGILDKYFPNSLFFNQLSSFKKKFISFKKKINYTIILTPNSTHFAYIKFALSNGSNVICEKPLVLTIHHLKQLEKLEIKYNRRVFTILQLRTLKVIKKLKQKLKIDKINKNKKNYIKINYITPRGLKYKKTWKGNFKKSGGILFNIGIHLLDLLCYLFGDYKSYKLIKNNKDFSEGKVLFNNTKADFYLSINKKDLKKYSDKKLVVRDFIINGKKIDLFKNSSEAHINCYKEILNKKLFGIQDIKKSIQLTVNLLK